MLSNNLTECTWDQLSHRNSPKWQFQKDQNFGHQKFLRRDNKGQLKYQMGNASQCATISGWLPVAQNIRINTINFDFNGFGKY